MPSQVGWGSECSHSEFWSDRHRNHVLFQRFTKANAGIISIGNDIDETTFDTDFDVEVGIFSCQAIDDRPQYSPRRMRAGSDPNSSSRTLAKLRQRRQLVIDRIEGRSQRLDQAFTGLRGRNAACRAGKQPQAQFGFQAAHSMAQR